ncbi:hypothetical protein HYW74_05100 [Candidatus Pacearchaeota archaeon]|nr:hypothetical protein [Candidatus Pacearchaeota archaeon]
MAEYKCEKCDREFASKEALDMHNSSKHYEDVKKPILKISDKRKTRNWILIIVAVLIIIGIAYFLAFKENPNDGKYDSFAQCLSEKNTTMYGAFWCPHCKEQKKAFGSSWQYINYIECSTPDGNAQLQICKDANIDGYPTWQFADGTRRDGFVPLADLARITNCSLG